MRDFCNALMDLNRGRIEREIEIFIDDYARDAVTARIHEDIPNLPPIIYHRRQLSAVNEAPAVEEANDLAALQMSFAKGKSSK